MVSPGTSFCRTGAGIRQTLRAIEVVLASTRLPVVFAARRSGFSGRMSSESEAISLKPPWLTRTGSDASSGKA